MNPARRERVPPPNNQPSADQLLSVPSTTTTRRWSPQYIRPAHGVQRHSTTVDAGNTGHWPCTPSPSHRSRSGGSSNSGVEDTDSSTDDSYTPLNVQPPRRRHRRRYPAVFNSSRRHLTDDDDRDNLLCELFNSR